MKADDDHGLDVGSQQDCESEQTQRLTNVELQAQVDQLKREYQALLEQVGDEGQNHEPTGHEWTQVLDAIDRPVFVYNAQFRIVRANRAYAEQAGIDARDLIGRLYYKCFPRIQGAPPVSAVTSHSTDPSQERIELDDGRVLISRRYPIVDDVNGDVQTLQIIDDITQRERAEAQARTLEQAVQQAAEGMFILDASLKFTYVNPALTALTGYTPEALIGQPVEVLRPGDAGPDPQKVREVIMETGHWCGEVNLLAADDSLIPVNLTAAALFDERGEMVGFVNSFLDLRPIKQAGHQVETLFESIEDLSLQLDVDTVAHKAMAAAARVCGADAAAVAVIDPASGLLRYRWHIGFSKSEHIDALGREFDRGKGIAGAVLRDHSTKVIADYPSFADALPEFVKVGVRSALSVPVGAGNAPSGVLSMATLGRAHDFNTTHVRFAEALARQLGVALQREQLLDDVRAYSQRLAQVFETVPDVLFALRPENFGLELISPAVTDLLGYTPEEMVADPMQWLHQVHEEDRGQVLAELRRVLEDGDGLTMELRMWHRDGLTLRWFESRGVVERDARGGVRTVIGALTDITARRQNEAQLLRVNRALSTLSRANEALVRAKDESDLLQEVCTNIADVGNYPLAWVGLAEGDASGTVLPAAWAGRGSAYLEGLHVTWGNDAHGAGPIGTAIRTGEPVIARDMAEDPRIVPWRERALKHGLRSLIAVPLILESAPIGALAIYARDANAFDASEQHLLTELANDLTYGLSSLRTRAERERVEGLYRDSLVDTIQAVARTVEKRDPYTAGHQQRVAQLAVVLATEMGVAPDRIEGLRLGSLIHDIGKIYIPSEILNRPGRLTTAEFEIIKTHSEVGYDIVKDVCFPWPVAQMILQHHERLDGSGYPQGLKGEQIILEARIMAVADVVEAITSHRPYRPGFGPERALDEIRTQRGTRYDSDVVDACIRLFETKGFTMESLTA